MKYSEDYELQRHIAQNNSEIAGWALSIDPMSGAFELTKGERQLFATPLWEGFDNIPVDEFTDDDYKHLADIHFKNTGNLIIDEQTYIELMTKFLTNLK